MHGDGDDDAVAIMDVNVLCDVNGYLKDGSKVHMAMDMAQHVDIKVNLHSLDRNLKAIVGQTELLGY